MAGRGLEGPAAFRVYFLRGGCGTFLRVFFELIGRLREMDAASRAAWIAPAQMAARMPAFQAFVDPSDPSRLFLSQPAAPAPPPGVAGGPAAPAPPGYSYS